MRFRPQPRPGGTGSMVPAYAGTQAGLQGTKSEMASVEHLLDSIAAVAGAGRPKLARPQGDIKCGGPTGTPAGPAGAVARAANAAGEKQRRQLESTLDLEKAKVRSWRGKAGGDRREPGSPEGAPPWRRSTAPSGARALAAQVDKAAQREAADAAARSHAVALAKEEQRPRSRPSANSMRSSAGRCRSTPASRPAGEADLLRQQIAQASQQLTLQAADSAAELAKERSASAAAAASLSDELGHVYTYAVELENIIEGVRSGRYPTLLREAFRRVLVPNPGGLLVGDRERLQALASACKTAASVGRSLEAEARASRLQAEVAALHQRLQAYEAAEPKQAAARTLEEEARQRVQEEFLEEMKADATVQYISGLEAENMRLRQAIKAAAQAQQSQATALTSFKRMEEKLTSRTGRLGLHGASRRQPR
eukprot:jgi/Botrbrau1/22231/Bobra.168_1s0062.1